jgi:DNA-binding CsgD family transcriptional regulator
MQDTYNKLFEPPKKLKEISYVKLTNRELDILACLMYRRVSDPTIAEILTINKRTVETHIRNITQKLNCSTRTIRKLVEEKTGSNQLADHYQNLLCELGFKKLTTKINTTVRFKQKNLCDVVIYAEVSLHAKLNNILPYLQRCGINAVIACADTFNSETLKANSSADVFLSSEKPSFNNFNDKAWFEYTLHTNSYQIILDIVTYVLPNPEIKALIDMFLRGASATNILDEDSNIELSSDKEKGSPKKNSFVISRKNLLVLFISIIFFIIGVSFTSYFISGFSIHGQKRAEVLLPPDHALLERNELVCQLKHLLCKKYTDLDSEVP